MKYSIVIPVLNQLRYTEQCVRSLTEGGSPASALLIINNGSTDETYSWLTGRGDLPYINNQVNLGCGGAWTQGVILRPESDWLILLNNDTIAPHGFADRLIGAGERLGFDVVSPALFEGPLDYAFAEFEKEYSARMSGAERIGWAHGVCFAVRREVFEKTGFFDTDRRLGGHEDTEFFVRCRYHGVRIGTTGSVALHHFGSITQKALSKDLGIKNLGERRFAYRRMGMSWLDRKLFKMKNRQRAKAWIAEESSKYGYTLHLLRENSGWNCR